MEYLEALRAFIGLAFLIVFAIFSYKIIVTEWKQNYVRGKFERMMDSFMEWWTVVAQMGIAVLGVMVILSVIMWSFKMVVAIF